MRTCLLVSIRNDVSVVVLFVVRLADSIRIVLVAAAAAGQGQHLRHRLGEEGHCVVCLFVSFFLRREVVWCGVVCSQMVFSAS